MKDRSIITLVGKLRARFGPDAFVIRDHWESDLCAIGIAALDEPTRLVHISTFGKPEGRYDVSLELPPVPGDDFPYTPAADRWDLDFEGLATLLGEHLGIE